MDSAEVAIPLADGAHVTANVSSPLSTSVTSTKRSRDNDEECEDSVATKVPATSSVCFFEGRSDSSSHTYSSSSSMSQEEDQQIGGEGDAVMHMNLPALTDEYKLCFSAEVGNGPELRQTHGQCLRSPKFCSRARVRGLRGGWNLDSGALCPLTGENWDLS